MTGLAYISTDWNKKNGKKGQADYFIIYLDQLLIHQGVAGVVDPCQRVVLPVVDRGVEEPGYVVDDAQQDDGPDDGVSGVDVAPVGEGTSFLI